MMKKFNLIKILSFVLVIMMLLCACESPDKIDESNENQTQALTSAPTEQPTEQPTEKPTEGITLSPTEAPTQEPTDEPTEEITDAPTEAPTEPAEIPATTLPNFRTPQYDGKIVIEIDGGQPSFKENQITVESYEYYSPLDSLGRCGVTVACIGKDLMPTDKRGSVSSVTPTGWHGGNTSIYERSHLIGWQLTGENANKSNLISGTRNLNGEMVTFENMVADYIKETGNHVMYRVTPIFEGNNLLASGVHMEAYSVEDNGEGISYNVYICNVQTDYDIDYSTGDFELSEDSELQNATYVINKGNKKFHVPTCSAVADMKESNKEYTTKTKEELIEEGYTIAGCCKNKA